MVGNQMQILHYLHVIQRYMQIIPAYLLHGASVITREPHCNSSVFGRPAQGTDNIFRVPGPGNSQHNITLPEKIFQLFQKDIIIGKGPAARSLRIDIAKFTLIGATTRAGSLSEPLRDRFGIVQKFEFYTPEEIRDILRRTAYVLNTNIDDESLEEISRRSRGTPRIGNRLLKRVRDFSSVISDGNVTIDVTKKALDALGVDPLGLEKLDRDILATIIKGFNGGPVGIETIASAIGEERVTIEDANEPYLIQAGLLYRTQKGRVASKAAYEHLGLMGFYREPETEQLRIEF